MDQATRQALLVRLEQDAQHLCARFGLRYRVLEAERANVKRRYGVCFSDGTIRIRLRHAATGRPLKYSSLVNTLCHELAHLRHFNHGPHFQAFYARILEWARREGIYRPKLASEATWTSASRDVPPPGLGAAARPAFAALAEAPPRRHAAMGGKGGKGTGPGEGGNGKRGLEDGNRGGRGVPQLPTSMQLELFAAAAAGSAAPRRSASRSAARSNGSGQSGLAD